MSLAFSDNWDRQWLRSITKEHPFALKPTSRLIKPIKIRVPRHQRTPQEHEMHRKALYRAAQIVCRAIKSGKLPSLKDGKTVCVDCKIAPATKYEHRDYAKPLEVEPVCQRCNSRRGSAIVSAPVPARTFTFRKPHTSRRWGGVRHVGQIGESK